MRCCPHIHIYIPNLEPSVDYPDLDLSYSPLYLFHSPTMASSTETKTYKGSCHCGAFEYELTDVPIIKGANRCNCSICARKGIAWVFAPSKDAFKVVKGEGTLREYTFGKGALAHYVRVSYGSSVVGQRMSAI